MKSNINKQYFFTSLPRYMAYMLLAYAIGFAIWTIFFTETGNGDNVEHIHATWLIAHGKIPYRDFFEHHNPLLWYLFSPFIRFFYNQQTILDVAHALGLVGGILTFIIIYKIGKKYFATSFATILSIITLCPPCFYVYCFNYNPDTFMVLCLVVGIYYLFSYLQNETFLSLIISFFCFFLSFMFTQKVLIILGQLGLIILFIFMKRKNRWSHFIYALILPIMCLILFCAYLYYENCLGLYFKSNYEFNIKMQDFLSPNKIAVMDYKTLIFSVSISICSILYNIKNSSVYFKIIAFLFITELLQRCFYFSVSPYYLLPLMFFTVLLNSVFINKIIQKKYFYAYIFIIVSFIYAIISPSKYINTRGKNRSFSSYLAQNITPCDYVISGFLSNQAILSKSPLYYWSILGFIDIVGEEVGIKKRQQLNNVIEKYKPKLVYGGPYWNNYYLNRGEYVLSDKVDEKILDKYYLPTPFKNFYILKYEFRHYDCRYNKEKNDWFYNDES